MYWYSADLHLHSALSPCGADEMTPPAIAAALARAGIGIAALTDHNSCQNSGAFAEACALEGLTGLYGMELETSEEVHLLCLFGALSDALNWQQEVHRRLPGLRGKEHGFGEQLVLDSCGRKVGTESRLLSRASTLSLDHATQEVRARGGICVPAHIDRPAYGLLGVLGLVPPDLDVEALEISPHASGTEMRQRHGLVGFTVVSFSDAHHLDQVLPGRTALLMAEPTFAEVRLALAQAAGRRAVLLE